MAAMRSSLRGAARRQRASSPADESSPRSDSVPARRAQASMGQEDETKEAAKKEQEAEYGWEAKKRPGNG